MNRSVTIFIIRDTPIKVNVVVLGNIVAVWGIAAWLGCRQHPDRFWWVCLFVGFLAMVVMLIADIGHAIAHIFSAHYAGARMDEVRISMGMPRTIYLNNEVPPSVHRMRAIGGPIFSAAGLLISLLAFWVTPNGSVAREIAGWSSIGHGFILVGCLMPFPFVDGGTLIKWTLVARGRTPSEADEIVRRVDLAMSLVAAIIGVFLFVEQNWIAGFIFLGIAGVASGAYLGKIR